MDEGPQEMTLEEYRAKNPTVSVCGREAFSLNKVNLYLHGYIQCSTFSKLSYYWKALKIAISSKQSDCQSLMYKIIVILLAIKSPHTCGFLNNAHLCSVLC